MHGGGQVEENYAKPWGEAWQWKSRGKLCQAIRPGMAKESEENYAKGLSKA